MKDFPRAPDGNGFATRSFNRNTLQSNTVMRRGARSPLADDIVANILCSCDSCGLCELARRTWEAFEHVAPELETPA